MSAKNNRKLEFHVRQVAKSLNLAEATEAAVDRCVATMLEEYQEYRLQPLQRLKADVDGILKEQVKSSNEPSTPLMSLNDSINNGYGAINSKRQRPQDPHESANNEGNKATELDTSNVKGAQDNGKKKAKQRMAASLAAVTLAAAAAESVNEDVLAVKSKIQRVPRPMNRLSDFAGLNSAITQLKELVFFPVLYPQLYTHLGVTPACGVLLQGPTGCGKTSLANAVAGELDLPFFKVSGPELIGGTSGESEERIRDVFRAAIAEAPSILFIDSLDVLASKREVSQRGMDKRVVIQLCDCIDEVAQLNTLQITGADTSLENNNSNNSPKKFIFLLAATNKADNLDTGVRGRFAKEISLPVPDAVSRSHILRIMAKPLRLYNHNNNKEEGNDDSSKVVDFDALGVLTPGYVGSDLRSLASEAGAAAASRLIRLLHSINNNNNNNNNNENNIEKSNNNNNNNNNNSNNSNNKENITLTTSAVVDGSGEQLQLEIVEGDQIDNNNNNNNDLMCVDQQDNSNSSNSNHKTVEQVLMDYLYQASSSPSSSTTTTTTDLLSTLPPAQQEQLQSLLPHLYVTMDDFRAAVASTTASATREGFSVAPSVSWSDVGALTGVRAELQQNLLEAIKHPLRYQKLGLQVPAGVLFFGPPGCGKTLLAKAVATESGANFISVKGPELLNLYVGESESRVRQVFARARASSPCVIFFDELDALCPRRGGGHGSGSGSGGDGNGVSERVVNQLLTEMDGVEARKDVYIMAATNRLELIDEAMLRPGRLGKLLYVPLPSPADRCSILQALMRKVCLNDSDDPVDVDAIAQDPRCEGFSGADMAALVREAGLQVLKEWRTFQESNNNSNNISSSSKGEDSLDVRIGGRHVNAAFTHVHPSVSVSERQRYERVHGFISSGMSALQALHNARKL